MNQEIEHNDEKQSRKPYIEWDESIVLPSRKSRHQKRKKEQPKQPKVNIQIKPDSVETNVVSDSKTNIETKVKAAVLPEVQPKEQTNAPQATAKVRSTKQLTGEQLRQYRIRYVRTMRFLRFMRRICLRIFLYVAILFLSFWWKFVYVYDLPPYIQQQFPQTTAFIAWKPWSFGPPVMNLRNFGNPANQEEMSRYLIRMDSYKDVVIHPIIIWSFKEH